LITQRTPPTLVVGWSDLVEITPDSLKSSNSSSKGGVIAKKRGRSSIISSRFSGHSLRSSGFSAIGTYLSFLPIGVSLSLICHRDRVQNTLEANGKPGNETLLFHGTNRACLLGESSTNVLLCGLEQCYLCSIVRSSFDVSKCGSKNSFKRFGHGIYTTSCSSKADDYVSNFSESASLRVMILSRVVVGRPDKRYRNSPHLSSPSSGYDSIAGETGRDLNYEGSLGRVWRF
jgi:hypothetical protein